ncbi:transglutaminase domain-containing protein [Candidatus Bathyarchaeota archaeon]|nr:transglutaminase domain-containing protein [Candidatus Bathyarchaeota archaeon]
MNKSFDFLVAGLPENVQRLEENGNFKAAALLINKILKENNERLPEILKRRLEWEIERIERVKKDYTLTLKDAFNSLKDNIPTFKREVFERWIKEGFIEYRLIEGEKRVFKNFLPNLLRDCKEAKDMVKRKDEKSEKASKLLNEHLDKLIKGAVTLTNRYVEPVKNRILMTLKLKPKVVPQGETVRVWLPFPREDPLQPKVTLISANPKNYVLAPKDTLQRTIYFENEVANEDELEFKVEYEYVVNASFQRINPDEVEKDYSERELYEKYTSEQLPHIAFTPYLRSLAEEIVKGETNPYFKAWKIYKWITTHVRYALVPEYSTLDCISEYAARNLRGDCGVQALLFITLCRINGVPARWQSGWYLNPISAGPHDWTQFYVEPYGWLYADPSFGGHRKDIEKYHRFYFGNVDHFRLIANNDISSDFHPPKKHYRSDNVDNQRGEVEWAGGNLYYDKWTYELKVLSHEKV